MDTSISPDNYTVDNCDKEPIHTPGRIQPFGMLIAGPADLSQIQYVSENSEEFLGLLPEHLLGSPFKTVLGEQIVRVVSCRFRAYGHRRPRCWN